MTISNPDSPLHAQMAQAIRDAERCDYHMGDGDCCDGLEGCDDCLAAARDALLACLSAATPEAVMEAALDAGRREMPAVADPFLGPALRAAAPFLVGPSVGEIERLQEAYQRQVAHTDVVRDALREELARGQEIVASLQRSSAYETERAQQHMAELATLRQQLDEAKAAHEVTRRAFDVVRAEEAQATAALYDRLDAAVRERETMREALESLASATGGFCPGSWESGLYVIARAALAATPSEA